MGFDTNPSEREKLRLAFYHEYQDQQGLASVAVRRDRKSDIWFLDVGCTRSVKVPLSYHGLEVRSKPSAGAINAVATLDQVH
ncbi:MAG TPA: hypothetical protein VK781_04530 [Solirubrobacteraceae bacterium]|jgi:hypothetical protein|nr:hypothetical protein [Solirubrobacteraceae bacterium]